MLRVPREQKKRSRLLLLREPGVATVVLASFAARLPLSMMGLATIFFVQEEAGSVAVAGFAVAAFSLMAGIGAPLRGRLVDRRGIRGGLLPLAFAHALATGALLLAAQLPGADALLVVVAGLGGATAPPVNAAMRALWPTLVPSDDLDAAYGLEAVLQEVSYIAGPLIAGALIALVSVSAPIVLSAVLVAVGGLLFSSHPAASRLPAASKGAVSALRAPGVRVLVASLGLGAVALGILDVAIPVFGEDHGSAASAGLLISAMSLASLVGGVWYATRQWRGPAVTRFIAASAIATLGYAAMVLAASPEHLAVGLLVFGATLAPGLAAVYSILDDVAPKGSAVESLTWITTASAGGAALGAVAAGLAIDWSGIEAALALGTLAMATATGLPIVWRGYLEAPEEEQGEAAPPLPQQLEVPRREALR
jgi:MFS family permease